MISFPFISYTYLIYGMNIASESDALDHNGACTEVNGTILWNGTMRSGEPEESNFAEHENLLINIYFLG